MDINKKAQTGVFYLFMIGIVLFILGFQLGSVLVVNNTGVLNTMDCNNNSISVDRKVTCTTIDVVAPWVSGLILGLGGLAFGSKVVFS